MKRIRVKLLVLTMLIILAVAGVGCNLCDWICSDFPDDCISNPSIKVEKYVSVDHGYTWIDANTLAEVPEAEVGQCLKYRFVITNTGDVTLTNITLSDPQHGWYIDVNDYDTYTQIIDPLPAGEYCEARIGFLDPTYPYLIYALEGTNTNTATATGDYGSITCDDTDDCWYK